MIKLAKQVRGIEVRLRNPLVMRSAVTLPAYLELQAATEYPAIKNVLNDIVCAIITNLGWRRGMGVTARDWVWWSRTKVADMDNIMQAGHRLREVKAVCMRANTGHNMEGAQEAVG